NQVLAANKRAAIGTYACSVDILSAQLNQVLAANKSAASDAYADRMSTLHGLACSKLAAGRIDVAAARPAYERSDISFGQNGLKLQNSRHRRWLVVQLRCRIVWNQIDPDFHSFNKVGQLPG